MPFKVKTITGEAPKSPEDIYISDGHVRSQSKLKGYIVELDRLHGEGNWGDAEVKRLIQEKEFAKYKDLEELRIQPEDFNARLAEYLSAFENPTPNDIEGLRQMVSLEMQMESNRQLLSMGTRSPDDLKTIIDMQKILGTEHRNTQKLLGIDRERRKTKTEKALDLVLDQIDRAREFIEVKLIEIEHCNIHLGWIKNDFKEIPWEYKARCPKCGQELTLSGGDMEALKDALDEKALKGLA